jgi:hypothetical protein
LAALFKPSDHCLTVAIFSRLLLAWHQPVHFGILTVFNLVFGIIHSPFRRQCRSIPPVFASAGVGACAGRAEISFFAGIVRILLYTTTGRLYLGHINAKAVFPNNFSYNFSPLLNKNPAAV